MLELVLCQMLASSYFTDIVNLWNKMIGFPEEAWRYIEMVIMLIIPSLETLYF